MQKFVQGRERAASPQHAQNGSRVNSDRRAVAANAKVPVKGRSVAQPSNHAQHESGLPSRGGSRNAQNSSAAIQQAPPRRPSGQAPKVDLYDTDAESIDTTTINVSVGQVEDIQAKNHQGQGKTVVVDLGSEGTGDCGEESGDDEDGEEDVAEDEVDDDGYVFTQQHVDFLEEQGQVGLNRPQAAAFLAQNFPTGFRTVDGDSYPSTTDGNPTEWDGAPQTTSEDFGNGDPLSPSPRHHGLHAQQPTPTLKRHGQRNGENHQPANATRIFQQSANIRDQQRSKTHQHRQPRQDLFANSVPEQSSQPPSYSQVKQEHTLSHPFDLRAHLNHPAFAQPQNLAPRQSVPAVTQTARGLERPITINRSLAPHNQIAPSVQHPHVVSGEAENLGHAVPQQQRDVGLECDYEPDALHAMNYDALKNESFDTNPRAPTQPLSKEMLQKPLVERLLHVQQNFDTGKQSDFFRILPTSEWEDAGDWFLDQFSSIIKRTKEARHTKRKLAQGFEEEVEKRYKHVSKKQTQVKEAMSKMQAQGEGLVSRSPRASKSPKPKKR